METSVSLLDRLGGKPTDDDWRLLDLFLEVLSFRADGSNSCGYSGSRETTATSRQDDSWQGR